MMTRNELRLRLQKQPIISTHSHHRPDREHASLSLEPLLRDSYVNWCGRSIPSSNNREEMSSFLDAVRSRSYFVWLEKALMSLYDIDGPLNIDSWNTYDLAIRNAHKNSEWHLNILRNECRYESVFLDAFWSPGDDNGHPDLFKPSYRVNSIFYGYNRTASDHNGHNFQILQNQSVTDIDSYMELVKQVLYEQKQAGSPVLKCALAYDRTLFFEPARRVKAQLEMQADPDEDAVYAFQAYVMDRLCEFAAELEMPLQIHTGLGLMTGSNALQLQPLIARHPETSFWLMHGSYPWLSDIAGLTHAYPNVWADLCWLPLISPTAAKRLLHELIDVCNADRVLWGCDTWTSEESYGARLAFIDVLSQVLSERIEAGMMQESTAMQYAQAIMHDNAAKIL